VRIKFISEAIILARSDDDVSILIQKSLQSF